MDTITQALLGATIGQALFGRRLGRRALTWGAVGGLIPDLDMVARAVDPMGEMLYHRGPTHALWFGPVVGTALGAAAARSLERRRASSTAPEPDRRRAWIGLFVATLFTHPLLDVFTTYGTQLLAPFSNERFAWDAIGIVDPVYSLLLAAALVVGARLGPAHRTARRVALLALALSSTYVGYCRFLNLEAERVGRADLAARGVAAEEVRAYPTLFQPYLRRLVARDGNTVWVGWLSLYRPSARAPQWSRFEPNAGAAVAAVRATREGRIFEWFAMGQTAGSVHGGANPAGTLTVEIDDIRYGFPAEPGHGLWGMRARVDAEGRVIGEVTRFERPLPMRAGELMAQLLRLAFG